MGTLLQYEIKKIVNQRFVWVSFVLSFLLILVTVCSHLIGSYYVDGERIGSNYEMFQIDREYQKALDGRPIDEIMLKEMQEAYGKVPLDAEQYSLTEEYQKYARPYSAIYNYVRQTTGLSGMEALKWVVSTENLHTKRLERQEQRWESFLLTDTEKAYWKKQEEKLENPIIFQYAEGYSVLFSAVYTIGLLALFVVSVCLTGVFPQEHVRRTDQLILSSKHGRREVYWAKFLAGLLFSLLMSLLFILIAFISVFILYGTEGFDAAFQLIYAGYSGPISIGEAVIIAYAIVIVATVFMGAFVMMLSEVLHSSVGTLAIATGMIVLPMLISMPEGSRVLSQLWSYIPSDFVGVWSIFSVCTVEVFGNVVLAWQIVPVIYTVLTICFAFVTRQTFVKYQVSGR